MAEDSLLSKASRDVRVVASTERSFPVFSPVAEHSVLVEFGDKIDHDIHAEVLRLDKALASSPFDGFVESVPAYAGILIQFDPQICDHTVAVSKLRQLLEEAMPVYTEPRTREVLVCYDSELAPDLEVVAQTVGLSQEAVIASHLAAQYDVFMYGFAPGYAYLAGVPDAIQIGRKPAAVRGVAAGSVLVAGPQCLVSTITMPSGWRSIGRSPTRILTGNADRPFLFDVGDRVRFRRISRAEYEAEMEK